jgi:hypothetical protein
MEFGTPERWEDALQTGAYRLVSFRESEMRCVAREAEGGGAKRRAQEANTARVPQEGC